MTTKPFVKPKSLSGTLIDFYSFREGQNGKKCWGTVTCRCNEKLITLVFFGDVAQKAKSTLTNSGMEILFQGKFDPEVETKFLVSTFALKKDEVSEPIIVKESQAEKEYWRDYKKHIFETRGVVRIGKKWVGKDYAIQLENGKWVEKIELCMDILGPSSVTEELKSNGFSFESLTKGKSFDVVGYKKCLNNMLLKVAEKIGVADA